MRAAAGAEPLSAAAVFAHAQTAPAPAGCGAACAALRRSVAHDVLRLPIPGARGSTSAGHSPAGAA